MGGDVCDVAARLQGAFPADEKGDTDAAFVGASLEAFLSGVEHHHGLAIFVFSELSTSGAIAGHAVVGHEDEDGVFFEIPLGELCHESAHVFIDVLDHAVKAGGFWGEAKIGEAFGIGRRCDERTVGRIGGDVGEEGLVGLLCFLHPTHGGGEKEVGAVAFCFHEGSVVTNGGVKVFVAGNVGAGAFVALADTSGSVNEDFIKSAFVGLVGFFITEVPFAEDSRGVACGF